LNVSLFSDGAVTMCYGVAGDVEYRVSIIITHRLITHLPKLGEGVGLPKKALNTFLMPRMKPGLQDEEPRSEKTYGLGKVTDWIRKQYTIRGRNDDALGPVDDEGQELQDR